MGRASYSGPDRRARPRGGRFAPRVIAIVTSLVGVAIAMTLFLRRGEREEAPPNAVSDAAPHVHGSLDPTAVEAALQAADAYMSARELPKAKAIATRLVDRAPDDPRAHELLGTVLAREANEDDAAGRADRAVAARREAYERYRTATRLAPGVAGLEHGAGLMAMAAGQVAAAGEHFDRAAELDPANPQYPLFAAQVLIQRGRLDEAEAALDRTLLLDPDEPSAHASRAVIALERGRLDEALAHVLVARRIAPRDARFRAQEARVHRRRGEPRRALELLAALSPVERADDAVAFELAGSYGDLGNHAAAAEAWAHRFAHGPRDARRYLAAVRAGEARLRAGDREAAARWLSSARALAPAAPEVAALERMIPTMIDAAGDAG